MLDDFVGSMFFELQAVFNECFENRWIRGLNGFSDGFFLSFCRKGIENVSFDHVVEPFLRFKFDGAGEQVGIGLAPVGPGFEKNLNDLIRAFCLFGRGESFKGKRERRAFFFSCFQVGVSSFGEEQFNHCEN